MTGKSKTALAALVAAVGLGAVVFWPRKASAAQGTSKPSLSDAGEDTELPYPVPKDAREAYTIGTALTTKDAAYVQFLADWLNANARDHADWAFALNQRAAALRAEVLLGEGLLQSTDLTRVLEISRTLQSTHPAYSALLARRIGVQRGELSPPPATTMELISGGSMLIDLSIYKPSAGGGTSSPVTPTPAVITPTVVVSPKPSVVIPADAPPLVAEEVKPSNDPNGTILLARILLDEQGKPNWKYVSNAVAEWQKKVGLTSDGKFGPGSAVKMAEEVAIMPYVRYWPLGSVSKERAVSDYRGRLKAVAVRIGNKYPEHATMLIRSADLEKGQGWPTKPASAAAKEPTEAEILAAKQALTTLLLGKKSA